MSARLLLRCAIDLTGSVDDAVLFGVPVQASQSVFAEDETHVHWLLHVRASWTLWRHRPEVLTPGSNQRVTVYGALEVTSGDWIYQLGSRCAAEFIALLRLLLDEYPRAPRIAVICDNDSIHTAAAVATFTATQPRLMLYPLTRRPTDHRRTLDQPMAPTRLQAELSECRLGIRSRLSMSLAAARRATIPGRAAPARNPRSGDRAPAGGRVGGPCLLPSTAGCAHGHPRRIATRSRAFRDDASPSMAVRGLRSGPDRIRNASGPHPRTPGPSPAPGCLRRGVPGIGWVLRRVRRPTASSFDGTGAMPRIGGRIGRR
ncbi:hypothetical protein GZH49_37955 [Nocardia terpenica]